MKNAATYEKKIRKLLASMPKAPAPAEGQDPVELLILSILEANSTRKAAQAALHALTNEFVDLNELRVTHPKEVVDIIGRDYPQGREKAESLVKSLNGVFDRTCQMSLAYMEKMPKRELRKHLESLGLSPFAASSVVLHVFGGHAVPVDQDLVESLEMEDAIHPGSDLADVQGFLERIVAQKDALSAHEFFRAYIEKNAKALAKKRKEQAEALAKVQEAKRIADEKAAAEKAAKEAAVAAKAAAKAQIEAAKAAAKAQKAAAKHAAEKSKAARAKFRASRKLDKKK